MQVVTAIYSEFLNKLYLSLSSRSGVYFSTIILHQSESFNPASTCLKLSRYNDRQESPVMNRLLLSLSMLRYVLSSSSRFYSAPEQHVCVNYVWANDARFRFNSAFGTSSVCLYNTTHELSIGSTPSCILIEHCS